MNSTSNHSSRRAAYQARVLSDLALTAAALGVLVAATLTSWLISKLTSLPNGFDRSVKVLVHYSDYYDYIYAYFATVLLLIGATLLVEPSDVGRFFRRHIFIPALEIAEHMSCLALGVFTAQRLGDLLGLLTISNDAKPPLFNALAILLGTVVTSGALVEFLRNDLDGSLARLGRFRIAVTVTAASLVVLLSLNDMLWNFKTSPVLFR
jgi:hypothetical protein